MMRRVSSRTRHRVARRLTRAARSTPPNPPQMASKDGSTFFFTSESVNEGHPDKLADQVRDRATCRFGRSLSTRTVAFSPDGIAKTSRGDPEVSRPPRASRRVSNAPLTSHPPHASRQISDGVLDACLAQDPDSKVRLRPRKRSPVESAKTTRRASETFFATRAARAETRAVERSRPRLHRARKPPRQPPKARSAATRRGRLGRLGRLGRTRDRVGRARRAADTSDERLTTRRTTATDSIDDEGREDVSFFSWRRRASRLDAARFADLARSPASPPLRAGRVRDRHQDRHGDGVRRDHHQGQG